MRRLGAAPAHCTTDSFEATVLESPTFALKSYPPVDASLGLQKSVMHFAFVVTIDVAPVGIEGNSRSELPEKFGVAHDRRATPRTVAIFAETPTVEARAPIDTRRSHR